MTGDELLADVLANPDDDGPRLVYADWLAALPDPRGELITVQCAIAAAGTEVPPRLTKRASQLISKHGKKWRAVARNVGDRIEFRRGFVTSIRATALAFADRGAALVAREPLEVLEIADAAHIERLAPCAHLARLRRIQLEMLFYHESHADSLRAFLASANFAVRDLDLVLRHNTQSPYTPLVQYERLFTDLSMSSVTHLRFIAPAYGYPAFAKVKLPALKRLELSGWSVDAAALELLTRTFKHAKVRARR